MAALVGVPPMSQLSAGHTAVYDAYFRQADVKGSGQIAAVEAASFLKKSNLKEGILHKIWELCDPQGSGFLDKHRFFLALRLIALAQNGKDVVLSNLALLVPAPNLGDIAAPTVPPPVESTVWSIKPADKTKYDHIFEGLKPVNGLLPGDKVRPVLLNSKLPIDVLGRVWDLSDIDRDGMLDADEFAVAMHLVYRALEGDMVPLTLPGRMVPPSKRKLKHPSSGPASPLMNTIPQSGGSPVAGIKTVSAEPWVVGSSDKLKFDAVFKTVDKDNDGLVSGEEVKNVFMQSGLPQPALAHIWGLCDITNSGRLNAEQFALALHLIQQKVKGVEPPQKLTPEMIPPSLRSRSPGGSSSDEKEGPGSIMSSLGGDFTAIKELDKISKDIEDLGREKMSLQREIDEKEEMIRQRNTEIQNIQSDIEKTKLSIQELEKQRHDTQAKLDELDKEKAKYEDILAEVKQKCQEQSKLVSDLQSQIQSNQKSILQQEDELGDAKVELNKLRDEETKLEQDISSSKEYLETVQKQCKSVQAEITQVRSKLATLNETNSSLHSQIAHYNTLINSSSAQATTTSNSLPITDFSPLSEGFDMTPTPSETDAMSVRATAGSSPVSSISGFSVGSGRVDEAVDDFKDKETGDDFKDNDPFKSKENLFSSAETDPTDPFHTDDPFKSDPFHYKSVSFADPFAADPFAGEEDLFKNDPFKSELPANGEDSARRNVTNDETAETTTLEHTEPSEQTASGLSSSPTKPDPFAAVDPFGSAFPSSKNTGENFFSSDPFKPSTDDSNKTPTNQKKSFGSGKDPFGGDPFGSEDPFAAS